jgi:hypothetical protein
VVRAATEVGVLVREMLGALDCSDKRFALFLEGLVSVDVRPDESSQRRFAEVVNKAIKWCGAELRETDSKEGYPLFTCQFQRRSSSCFGRPARTDQPPSQRHRRIGARPEGSDGGGGEVEGREPMAANKLSSEGWNSVLGCDQGGQLIRRIIYRSL